MKKLEWQFSTGIAGGIVFLLGIPGKNGMVGKYAIVCFRCKVTAYRAWPLLKGEGIIVLYPCL